MADLINTFYSAQILAQAREQYLGCKNISLPQFLSAKGLAQFKDPKWKRTFHPLTESYHTAKVPQVIYSKKFANMLSAIIGVKIKIEDAKTFKFFKGDYTLLADSTKHHNTPAFILNINKPMEKSAWKEEFGGYTSFLQKNEEAVRVIPQYNKLFIIDARGIRSFTKYINHRAPFPITFITGKILPQ